MGAGVENVSDHGTIGPRKFLGLPENILCFRSKKEVLTRHKDKFLIGRLLNLKMTRTDALMNRPPPLALLRNVGDTLRMIRDYLTKLPPCGGITTVEQDHCRLIDK